MEDAANETLNLGDPDFTSRIRPCKQRRRTSSIAAEKPVSLLSFTQSPEQPPPCATRRRTIPGPAGTVQAAILHKYLDGQNRNISNYQKDSAEDFSGSHHCDGVIPTQDYIRRAMEDTSDFDDDFNAHPWISAMRFLGAQDDVVKSKPISAIKNCLNCEKVDKVVAVIKSCTPSGLGGLIVSLKDPTGTIGASIHHKVLSDREFGMNLTIGSVLILQKVTVFAPAQSAFYLNITLGNLVQVFCKDGTSTRKQYETAYLVQYADHDEESCGKAETNLLQNSENLQNRRVTERHNLFTESVQSTRRAQTSISISQKELTSLTPDVLYEISKDDQGSNITSDHLELAKGGKSEGSPSKFETQNMNNKSVTRNVDQEIRGINAVSTQSQPLKSKASLPQWTDEQLDELFAGDEDGCDGHFF